MRMSLNPCEATADMGYVTAPKQCTTVSLTGSVSQPGPMLCFEDHDSTDPNNTDSAGPQGLDSETLNHTLLDRPSMPELMARSPFVRTCRSHDSARLLAVE